jgi:S-formylglutathione hydrolase FrmB
MNKSCLLAGAALILGCLALPHLVFATGRAECLSAPSKIMAHPVAYCVLLPPGYDEEKARRYPILYLLHGLGDNEQMLIHSGGFNLVEDLWERHQLGDLLIVTPDGGSSFYINSRDGRRPYEDFFVREFLPQIEKRYRTKAGRTSRGIAGISMGGYGALHLAFRHPELFGSVGAHSAALLEKPPTVIVSDSRQVARSRILGDVFGLPFDPVFWKQNDPLAIARTTSLAGLQIYFDCGSEDDFGFDAGAIALYKMLGSRRIPHEFHLYPGGHNWVYVAEHLPALLQFHFRVFESGPHRREKQDQVTNHSGETV